MQTTCWISSARHLLVAMVWMFFCTAAVAMQISVETGSGASITLEVESSDSIAQVKRMIQDSTGIDPKSSSYILARYCSRMATRWVTMLSNRETFSVWSC